LYITVKISIICFIAAVFQNWKDILMSLRIKASNEIILKLIKEIIKYINHTKKTM